MAQLPEGAAAAAAGVLVWAFFCSAANIILLWLLWTCNERQSYIFIVSWVTLLATVTSIIEQINDIIYWEDIMWARYRWIVADPEAPMLCASGGAVGLGLVMWTIRWGCYVAETGISFFWIFSLTQAVYGWREDIRYHRPLIVVSELGKPFAILAAALTMGCLQLNSLQQSYWWWNFVLHLFYCLFLSGSLVMFILLGFEYLQTRRLFRRMNSQQRREFVQQPSQPGRGRSASNATSVITAGRLHNDAGSRFGALQQRQGGIYDKWLIARTFIPFVALCLFEVDNILINMGRPDSMRVLATTAVPDLSASMAQGYIYGFMPGCLASLVLPLAFGTTKNLRDRLYYAIVPVRLQNPSHRHKNRRSNEFKYVAMDNDNGILSRQKRLSMEKRLRIEVTYEFEVRNEQVEASAVVHDDAGAAERKELGGPTYPYTVQSHRWDDTERILPRKPSVSFIRGQF